MDIVAKGEKMPACDKENAGKMVFVTDSSAVYYCANKNWSSLNGKDGIDGEKGADGESVKGEDGTSCTAKEVDEGIEISCGDKVVGTIKNGAKGEDGKSIKGEDGTSCIAKEVDDGIEVSCGDEVIGTIKNGEDGKSIKGEDGKGCTAADTVNADGIAGYNLDCADKRIGTIWSGKDGEDLIRENGSVSFFIDSRDGKQYKAVTIGTQTWMAENLNYADEVATPNLKDNNWCNPNVENYCQEYGRLYSWTAAMNLSSDYLDKSATEAGLIETPHRGICPEGWHIPNNSDFNILNNFAEKYCGKFKSGICLKSEDGWSGYEGAPGLNLLGFNAKRTGIFNQYRNGGLWTTVHEYFWIVDEVENFDNYAYHFAIKANDDTFGRGGVYGDGSDQTDAKFYGMSVRCLKN